MSSETPVDRFKRGVDFDRSLTVGQEVEARWTNSNSYFRAKAIVTKVNEKSIRVKLAEALETRLGGYPVGHSISLPRLLAYKLHTVNNCACPLSRSDKAGPKYERGDEIPGRGKVVAVFMSTAGYSYKCDGESAPSEAA